MNNHNTIVYCLLIFVQLFVNTVNGDSPIESDSDSNITELITSRGFDYEVHYVTTEDGYILGVYRIINPFVDEAKRKQLRPIVIQHGFTSSGEVFLVNSEDGYAVPCDPADQWSEDFRDANDSTRTNNLGLLLANLCSDVWLANSRGNKYSRNHTTLDPDNDKDFWDFTFDEMIKYDTPNLIDYILTLTGQETLGWIGHSQGTLVMFGLFSEQPAYSLKVNPFIALAPVTYVGNISPILQVLADTPLVLSVLRLLGGELTSLSFLSENPDPTTCTPWEQIDIEEFIAAVRDYSPDLWNSSRLDIYNSLLVSEQTSVWDLVHFGQNIVSKKFVKFDYGCKTENENHYNVASPPAYDLSKINSTQMALFHSQGDVIGDPQDVAELISQLTVPLLLDYTIPIATWSHQDYLYAENLYEVVHTVILDVLRQSKSLESNPIKN